VFFPEIFSYPIDMIGFTGWLPGVFCALLCTFTRFGAGLERFLGGRDDFSDVFCHGICPSR
jgi:hypothetical protein